MTAELEARIAGIVRPSCSCCIERQELLSHVSLGATRRFCPATGTVYLDRGDGLFHPDGAALDVSARTAPPPGDALPAPVSDRPVKTAEKTRIVLEGATFA